MAAFEVHLSAPVTTVVEVEADTAEQAERVALRQVHMSLCQACAQEVNPPDDWTVESVERVSDQ